MFIMHENSHEKQSEANTMNLFQVGRLCVKLAGRDAGRKCVVVEQVDSNYVLVDGNVRRKKVNVKHLEPLAQVIEIKEKANHTEVESEFKKLGEKVWNTKKKESKERPKRMKAKKVKPVKDKKGKKEDKKESKKEDKKESEKESKESTKEESKLEKKESKEESIK
jgi:large subunit ribosomal protein L14e